MAGWSRNSRSEVPIARYLSQVMNVMEAMRDDTWEVGNVGVAALPLGRQPVDRVSCLRDDERTVALHRGDQDSKCKSEHEWLHFS